MGNSTIVIVKRVDVSLIDASVHELLVCPVIVSEFCHNIVEVSADLFARLLANFYCQFADRRMNLNLCDSSASEIGKFDNLLS